MICRICKKNLTDNSLVCPDCVDAIKKNAEEGDANSQAVLGMWYFYGDNGVSKDKEQAFHWLQKSAEQGNALAQARLGMCYYQGDGCANDKKSAIHWLKKSLENGRNNSNGQFLIGKCYFDGDGVAQDKQNAIQWFKKAAENGSSAAQVMLGECYRKGDGICMNKEQAVYWFKKAAEQNNKYAQYGLCLCYFFDGDEQDKKTALYWCRIAAEQGETYAQIFLGACYYCGIGTQADFKQSIYWLNKNKENDISQFLLGRCNFFGNGVPQNKERAFDWFKKSAEQGNKYSQFYLGSCYFDGNGVPQNKEKAVYWFKKAAEQGDQEDDAIFHEIKYKVESKSRDLRALLQHIKGTKTWQERFIQRIQKSKKTELQVYKDADISRQHFYKIKNNSNYSQKKETVILLGIGLELDITEMEKFLAEAGYAFSNINPTDIIIQNFITKKQYKIMKINEALEKHNLPSIGSAIE